MGLVSKQAVDRLCKHFLHMELEPGNLNDACVDQGEIVYDILMDISLTLTLSLSSILGHF